MLTYEAREFLERNHIKNYKINLDGTIDVDENISIFTDKSKLPVKFRKVVGHFDCDYSGLTSLDGVPSYVGVYFSYSYNQLTSLEGAPSYVGGSFFCDSNKLTSLHNIHKHIKEINGIFYCRSNPIKDSVLGLLLIKGIIGIAFDNEEVEKILIKYLGKGRSGVIGAQQELLDAGLDEFARL